MARSKLMSNKRTQQTKRGVDAAPLSGVLAGDAQAAARTGEYSVYLTIPAIVVYLILARRSGVAGTRS